MNIFGRLTLESLPLHEPIVVGAFLGTAFAGAALFAVITRYRLWGYLWREWFTTIDRKRIPVGAKYTPIATVVDSTGKNYGDAAGLIELSGGGRILYLACNLQHDPDRGFAFIEATARFLIHASKKR